MNIAGLKLEFVKEIEALEASVINEYRSDSRMFIEKLIKTTEHQKIFLVFESSKEFLDKYTHRIIPLRNLITESINNLAWIVTKDREQVMQVEEFEIKDLPADYLPASDIFYEEL